MMSEDFLRQIPVFVNVIKLQTIYRLFREGSLDHVDQHWASAIAQASPDLP